MTEFNLSDYLFPFCNTPTSLAIRKKDVKEFIKLLKEELVVYLKCEEGIVKKFDEKIDKLAGDKLI